MDVINNTAIQTDRTTMAPLALVPGSCLYLQCTELDKMYTTPLVSKPHPCRYVNKTTELSNPGFSISYRALSNRYCCNHLVEFIEFAVRKKIALISKIDAIITSAHPWCIVYTNGTPRAFAYCDLPHGGAVTAVVYT